MSLPTRVKLTYKQEQVMDEAFVSFMNFCPFFAYYFYDQMEVYYTVEFQTAATDGKRVFVNPVYMETLKPMERCFALAHETYHAIYKHPTRMKFYLKEGTILGLPFVKELFNVAADYVINADLVDQQVGTCNAEWLYDPKIKATELTEEVYKKLWSQLPPPPPPGQPGPCPPQPTGGGGTGNKPPQQGQQPTNGSGPPQLPPPKTKGPTGRPGGDKIAAGNNSRMDEILEPQTDPVNGKEDLPSEMEFREAITRAEAAARRAGKLPGNLQRVIDEIKEPTVSWKDEIRLKITGKVGNRREDWSRPNRRRIVLNPMIYLPARQGNGAELVTVVIDTSGSISPRELTAFFSETAAILNECRPKKVQLIWCDWVVQKVDEARSLDELMGHRVGSPGVRASSRPSSTSRRRSSSPTR
jgi:predicted metal-dependent peptidase